MYTRIIEGTYGSGKTPCDIFVYDGRNGLSWYVVDGSVNVNQTDTSLLIDGVDVEELPDVDMFTSSEAIESRDMLETEADEYENS